jgi:hypothetical protein
MPAAQLVPRCAHTSAALSASKCTVVSWSPPPRCSLERGCRRAHTAAAAAESRPRLRPRIAIVDREREIASVLCTFTQWHDMLARRSVPPRKPPLPFSSQLFGAGKTTFGRDMLTLLRADLPNPADKRKIAAVPHTLERYANAGHVELNLASDIKSGYPAFSRAFSASLLRASGCDHRQRCRPAPAWHRRRRVAR